MNGSQIIVGDCVEEMAKMPADSVDAIVTDPPYGIRFMGKAWDKLSDDAVAKSWDTKGRSKTKAAKTSDFKQGVATGVGVPKDNPRCSKCGRATQGRDTAKGFTVCHCESPQIYAPSVSAKKSQAWHEVWAREAFRVLKPGAYLLAFGGTRTAHRMVCAIEDAGFEIRDSVHWIYGSGFPKSLDVSKAIDKMAGVEREVVGGRVRLGDKKAYSAYMKNAYKGDFPEIEGPYPETAPVTEAAQQWQGWGTALKPAHEPIVMARKPLSEKNVAQNVLKHGTGAINVDGCRVQASSQDAATRKSRNGSTARNTTGYMEGWTEPDKLRTNINAGRWPPNLLLSHHPDCKPTGEVRRVKGITGGRPGAGGRTGIYGERKGLHRPVVQYADPDGTEPQEVWECVAGCPVRLLDEMSGQLKSNGHGAVYQKGLGYQGGEGRFTPPVESSRGGASRFFPRFEPELEAPFKYQAKASRAERGYYLKCNCETVKLEAWLRPDLSPSEQTALILQLKATSERVTDGGCGSSTTSSGKNTTDQSRAAIRSTTSTETSSTTESTISNSLPQPSTSGSTPDASLEMASGGSPASSAENPSQSLKNTGTSLAKGGRSTGVAVLATFPRSSLTKNCGVCGSEIKAEAHPTQKPIALMRWLVRLVTPPGGTVLDPFMGSGSTGCAAALEGFNFIGIEMDAEYAEIARRRIAYWSTPEYLRPVQVSTNKRNTYGLASTKTVARCAEHDTTLPSGLNVYECGCPIQYRKVEEIEGVAEAADPTFTGRLF